jgi:predicted DsbA family dithiol-disulfide isomerase
VNTIFDLRPFARRDNIVVGHDYLCPWCYVGWKQAKQLIAAYGVTLDWVGCELYPPSLPWSTPPPPSATPAPTPPPGPSRFDLFCGVEGIPLPEPRPGRLRTHNALLGAEYAKSIGQFDAFNDAVYVAYWERRENIEDVAVLQALAESVGIDPAALAQSIAEERFNENIVAFDDQAYALGIRHVPTFLFGSEELLAEAHYVELAYATERFLIRKPK